MGGSCAAGLGARGNSYPRILAELLGVDYLDLARRNPPELGIEAPEQLAGVPAQCGPGDLVVLGVVSDALLKPKISILSRLPKRYDHFGVMCPRAYFSSRRWKRTLQRFESFFTWRFRAWLIRTFGYEPTSSEAYRDALSTCIQELKLRGCTNIVIAGHPGIDERFFPGSRAEFAVARQLAMGVAESQGAIYIPIDQILHEWDDYIQDHFHPSEAGHKKVALETLACLGGSSD